MVVPADRPKCALWHAPILGFSRGLGIGEEHPERTSQEIGSVRNHEAGACLGWKRLPGVCLNQEGPRPAPGHRRLAPMGRKLSLFWPREAPADRMRAEARPAPAKLAFGTNNSQIRNRRQAASGRG